MSDPIISVRNFRMQFGRVPVIEDLSFDVHKGEVFGFLGSNGSGKTTTIRALLGLVEPASGTLLVKGRRYGPADNAVLGYLPEERGLYRKETVLETMTYFGRLKGMTKVAARRWSQDYLERVELGDKAHARLGALSGGQQQKVQFGVTIMSEPELLILDEPTKGLDPLNRRLMLDIVDERVKAGSTVVLVTHQMEEVERLCDRIILLKDGRRRLYGSVDEIRRAHGSNAFAIRFSGDLPQKPELYEIATQEVSWAVLVPAQGQGSRQIMAFLAGCDALEVESFEMRRPSIDEIFVQIYREGAA